LSPASFPLDRYGGAEAPRGLKPAFQIGDSMLSV
jgi:hypothetical protein